MKLTQNQIDAITAEYNEFEHMQYAGKELKERQEFGQFFTPPVLVVKMIEKFDDLRCGQTLLDPTCGAGGLLAACIVAKIVNPTDVYGIEVDSEILDIAKERLTKLGVPISHLRHGDALNPLCYEQWDNPNYRFNQETMTVTFANELF